MTETTAAETADRMMTFYYIVAAKDDQLAHLGIHPGDDVYFAAGRECHEADVVVVLRGAEPTPTATVGVLAGQWRRSPDGQYVLDGWEVQLGRFGPFSAIEPGDRVVPAINLHRYEGGVVMSYHVPRGMGIAHPGEVGKTVRPPGGPASELSRGAS